MVDPAAVFGAAGCDGSLSVVRLTDGARVEHAADRARVMASVVKVPIALEFYSQVVDGSLDAAQPVTVAPRDATPGPVGISRFHDPVGISLRDLAYLMLTVSDNAATDVVTEAVGIDCVNRRLAAAGCRETVVVESLREMLDGFGADLGFDDYAALLDAQGGGRGEEAQTRATDPQRIEQCRALDPNAASRTTAADATRLLTGVWDDFAGPPEACAMLRSVMAEQVTRRMAPAVAPGGTIAAKSGGLFRRVRNEIGVISDADGTRFAFAVLTLAESAEVDPRAVERAMVEVLCGALTDLREGG